MARHGVLSPDNLSISCRRKLAVLPIRERGSKPLAGSMTQGLCPDLVLTGRRLPPTSFEAARMTPAQRAGKAADDPPACFAGGILPRSVDTIVVALASVAYPAEMGRCLPILVQRRIASPICWLGRSPTLSVERRFGSSAHQARSSTSVLSGIAKFPATEGVDVGC